MPNCHWRHKPRAKIPASPGRRPGLPPLPMNKGNAGNFLEDFRLGQVFRHAIPRTLTIADQALYAALYGSRFALQSSEPFARALGYPAAPLDDLLVFHIVFGRSVADVSLNAIANLGLAECRFLAPVYPGDTLSATSEVIGLRQVSSGKAGIVYVRTSGSNQHGVVVLSYVRWVLIPKREAESPAPPEHVPVLAASADPTGFDCPTLEQWDTAIAGAPYRLGDYRNGEKIDHVDGVTVEEAEHQLATRLYQNPARVHFNKLAHDPRLVYGGHAMSIARALSFNGLGSAFRVAAINSARHVAPLHAGATVFAWSEILDVRRLRAHVGALRIVTRATVDEPCFSFPVAGPSLILELDYWAVVPAA